MAKIYLQKMVSFPKKVMASQPTHPPKGYTRQK